VSVERPFLRLGLQVNDFSFPGWRPDTLFDQVVLIARRAERAGFDSLFVMDHFHQIAPMGDASQPMLEAYTTLAALAACTERIQLGALVTAVTHRHPAVLAKIVTTLDVVSRGRAILGLGASWNEAEQEAFGLGTLSVRARLERLEDALRICRALFAGGPAEVAGRHHHVAGACNVPGPVRQGGIPIIVGGGGEKRTLRLAARYADACNLFGDAAELRHKLAVLDRHCAEVGRDPGEVERSALRAVVVVAEGKAELAERRRALAARWGLEPEALDRYATYGTPEGLAQWAADLRAAGLTGLVVGLPDASEPGVIELAGRALREVF
jgi:F420-dependent oxidoreductase-like protein